MIAYMRTQNAGAADRRRQVLRRAVGVVVAVVALGALLTASASAHPQAETVIHLAFHHELGEQVVSDGRYSFFEGSDGSGTLLDELTGARRAVSAPPACAGQANSATIGTTYLLWECAPSGAPTFELYPLASGGSVESTPVAPAISDTCATVGPSPSSCGPVDVGSQWIEFLTQCYHCGPQYSFQNIATGEVRQNVGAQLGATVDLSRTALSRQVCRPVATPLGGTIYTSGRVNLIYSPAQGGTYHTQRCGQPRGPALNRHLGRLRQPTAFIGLSNTLVVYVAPKYGGRNLPAIATSTGAQVRIPYPSKIAALAGVAIADRDVYITDANHVVWGARLPRRWWATS